MGTKSVVQAHGADVSGQAALRRRAGGERFRARLARARVGIEACRPAIAGRGA